MSDVTSHTPGLDRLQQRALFVGAAALAVAVAGMLMSDGLRPQFFRSYLLGYLFWIGLALGSLAIVMLHYMVGGGWGRVLRPLLDAGAWTLPLMAVLFVPLIFGIKSLYIWSQPEVVAQDALLQHKSGYLNEGFFIARAAAYFLIWIVLAVVLVRWSRRAGYGADVELETRFRSLSAPGTLLYALTITFASIDWVMSLEPHWYSTMYGVHFIVGQGLAALAFMTAAAILLIHHHPWRELLGRERMVDLGNLLLAFLMIWAYVAFSQFLIIWSGNLPKEIVWYTSRIDHGWQMLSFVLIVGHFFMPFLLLLSRGTKQSARMLYWVAAFIVLMRFVDLVWMVAPAFHPEGFFVHWMDVLVPVGLGGVWIAFFVRHLKGAMVVVPTGSEREAGA